MRVLICYPPLEGKGTPTLTQNRQFQWFHHPTLIYPLVPASAATVLAESGYEALWKDAIAEGAKWEEFQEFLLREKPELVVIETKTPVVKQHWEQTKLIKKLLPKTRIVLMGDHPTALPVETMEHSSADYIILGGDYDFSLLRLVEHTTKGKRLGPGFFHRERGTMEYTGPFEPAGELDQLPFIDRELTRWELYGEYIYRKRPFTYTMAGRDCPWGQCTFCAWTVLYPGFRVRSPENLISELKLLVEGYGVKEVFDDTGTFPAGGWLERFCELMLSEGLSKRLDFSVNFRFEYLNPPRAELMRKAGFRVLKLGLESANDHTLHQLNKNLTRQQIIDGAKCAKSAGLELHLTIMLGYPWETYEDIKRTLKLVQMMMRDGLADTLQSTLIIPYPGTALYNEARREGWFIIPEDSYERFDMTEPVLRTPGISRQRLMRLVRKPYEVFFHPRYLLRRVMKLADKDEFLYSLRGLSALLGHLRDFSRK